MNYPNEFIKLVEHSAWKDDFIGYGNPNAEVLIVGQEAALKEDDKNWKIFYAPNQNQWLNTIKHGYTYRNGYESNGNNYDFPQFFNPLFPFYKQKFSRLTKQSKTNEGTSATYYNYQKLINAIVPHEQETDPYLGKIVDFFRYAFITELNSTCRLNHTYKNPNIKECIAKRFDKMIATSEFWSQFKVVIMACGNYADALRKDENLKKAIFGNAKIIFTRQLSIMSDKELKRIIALVK